MKYNKIAVLFLLTCGLATQAQDLLVTTSGDSIDCKIRSFEDLVYNIEYWSGTQIVRESYNLDEVSFYAYRINKGSEASKKLKAEKKLLRLESMTSLRYSLGFGLVRAFEDHGKTNLDSYAFNAAFHGCVSKPLFLDGKTNVMKFESEPLVYFFGPSLKLISGKKEYEDVYFQFALGYYGTIVTHSAYDLNVHTLGLNPGIGYDFFVGQNFGLGLNLECYWGLADGAKKDYVSYYGSYGYFASTNIMNRLDIKLICTFK